MSVMLENQLSNEDYLLVETNMLGAPLSIYALKPSYIRFIRRVGRSIFWFGVIVLLIAVIGFFRGKSDDQFTLFLMTLLPASYAILKGSVFLSHRGQPGEKNASYSLRARFALCDAQDQE